MRDFLETQHGIIINDDEIFIHMLWADDLILMSSTAHGLQRQLDGLLTFCGKYQLIVNNLKTKIMIYGPKPKETPDFHFDNSKIDICTSYKYLGVVFNSVYNLRDNMFREMVDYTCDKARKASFVALKKCKVIGKPPPKIGMHLFDAFVLPVIQYACEIWCSGKECKDLERIQLKFIKMILGVKSSTANLAIYAETGRFPLYLRCRIRILKYVLRLINMNNNSIVKKVFMELKYLDGLGFKNWYTNVRNIFEECNLNSILDRDYVTQADVEKYVNTAKVEMNSRFEMDCMAGLSEKPVLRSYIQFKTAFQMENYLMLIKNHRLRKTMSKFRLSSHNLAIETGRHTKPKTLLEERLCNYCNMKLIEDECHFLVSCPFYEEERSLFISKCNINMDSCGTDAEKFTYIMSQHDENSVFYLSMYLQCTQMFQKKRRGTSTTRLT